MQNIFEAPTIEEPLLGGDKGDVLIHGENFLKKAGEEGEFEDPEKVRKELAAMGLEDILPMDPQDYMPIGEEWRDHTESQENQETE